MNLYILCCMKLNVSVFVFSALKQIPIKSIETRKPRDTWFYVQTERLGSMAFEEEAEFVTVARGGKKRLVIVTTMYFALNESGQ